MIYLRRAIKEQFISSFIFPIQFLFFFAHHQNTDSELHYLSPVATMQDTFFNKKCTLNTLYITAIYWKLGADWGFYYQIAVYFQILAVSVVRILIILFLSFKLKYV